MDEALEGPQCAGLPPLTVMLFCPTLTVCNAVPSVPEEKYLTLEGFHKFVIDRAKQDIRSVWRAILSCGYDLHFER